MDQKRITFVIDQTVATYIAMGLRGDQERREALRETIKEHVTYHVEQGQDDADRLVVLALKHLVDLEDRDPVRSLFTRRRAY